MKYVFSIFQMSFNKLLSGQKRVDIRLCNDELKSIRPHDVIEYVCREQGESLFCIVRGVMFFDTVASMEAVIPPEIIGYSNWDEIKLRLDRIFPVRERRKYLMLAIFVEPNEEHVNTRDFGAKKIENADKYMLKTLGQKESSFQTMKYRDERRSKEDEELEKNFQELWNISNLEKKKDLEQEEAEEEQREFDNQNTYDYHEDVQQEENSQQQEKSAALRYAEMEALQRDAR